MWQLQYRKTWQERWQLMSELPSQGDLWNLLHSESKKHPLWLFRILPTGSLDAIESHAHSPCKEPTANA